MEDPAATETTPPPQGVPQILERNIMATMFRKIEKEIEKLGFKPVPDETWREGMKDEWFARYYLNGKDVVLITVGLVTGEAIIEVLTRVTTLRIQV